MSEEILARLARAPVVPLVGPDDAVTGAKTAQALVDGGLSVVEVVLRTPAAIDCLGEIAQNVPNAIIGAGTVLTPDQAEKVIAAGAKFIVCPGLHDPIVRMAQEAGLPVFPGVSTATEAQAAYNMGLRSMKLFPASLCGGVPMLKALGAVFKDVKFMPTGGVSAANLSEYLAVPSVLACGGSWLTPKAEIEKGNYAAVTALAAEAVRIAHGN
ncbi:MAG: bifunctional 4-hydroxy-2-oxoglutarate aldolase/2-dehydro-3-deoxy-phosphogluconate aldolase [Gammaproteobacteria bacterium]|nr:bifunctional 4-hydroxy-2-oxoglutarate aldolase/2-dehydro-3-deoxy-phosphogluconate aldolase [Gammaproteobacteria bacterium]MBT8051045.1 bifunctional 4-hydroxy-2-oxoglutarate aldolase/2-dehydro-3-deoxy-phosphogluconate aldolase [Gammaproteobacteria bacterium]MBT8056475.1 bifunctional 4-hydroxy-2-oxoglutarate aldolase/2-dehydro-3-deoxy-phosphogluconate aldolase [Gammaproteobacteria bacterium]NNJ80379.1 bifunctional 4-hydroxy-2-oxoglutarate aldolase/2-dehydro-3-deoxy-phosphogluconate aldolase [Xa